MSLVFHRIPINIRTAHNAEQEEVQMTWKFVPFRSYGPLVFGMSQAQVIDLLAAPSEEFNSFDKLEPYIDPELHGPTYVDLLKRTTTLSFSASERNNHRPEISFFDGALAEIHMSDHSGELLVAGVNILGKNRVQIIVELARREQVMLFSGSNYYFESVGVRITAPKFWKESGSVGLYSHSGFEKEMDMAAPYEYGPEEITGRES